jgi:Ca2+-binding EF-hand superfamily protein
MKHSVLALAGALTLVAVPVLAYAGHGCGQALQAEVPALFTQADADGDGSLTADEFKVFKQLLAEKRTESMFQRIDVNGDGKVTLDEINAEAARRAQRHTDKAAP